VNPSQSPEKLGYLFPKPYADFVQRLRVPFGFVLLFAFGWLSHPTLPFMLIGIPVAVCGLLLRAWASGHLAKDQQLATSGPYSYIRNPLYVGTLVVAAGLVIASDNGWLSLLFAVIFILVYLPAVELEEQHLREIFPSYGPYARHVSRFLPTSRWQDGPRSFSWVLYKRNEEYKALLGFLLALAWLVWKCWYFNSLT
jgi:protein-S-isoprenylcysteine O-methyltransferase Ste14